MERTSSYPRAILHFDGDAFFASVEQAKDWRLRGRPVVTGGERGAATSLSYEAKARGVHRSMPMRDIRRICPDVVVVSSDYTSYSIFARRMYAIVREYTDAVEEYSIDECFADITGLEQSLGMSYEEIGKAIKAKLETSLGITFGVGLSVTKTLAKVASKHRKPAGFTTIPVEEIEDYLQQTEIYDVWGLGGASGTHLRASGVTTALEYIQKDEGWLKDHGIVKPQRATWLELRGHSVLSLGSGVRALPHSVMKTRTFSPPSMDRAYIFAQLSKNVEAACVKLRKEGVKAHALSFYLKTQEFTYHGIQMEFPVALSAPSQLLAHIQTRFDEVYVSDILYRASGVTLRALVPDTAVTLDLFGEFDQLSEKQETFVALDALNKKFGRHTVFLASSMQALGTETKERFLRSGPQFKKRINIPYLGVVT
ncbi:DNA polymerase IV [Patescibacteria group bacterium]|nr:DNA polymerase IV [Patescibacteria group bacterium]